MRKQKQYLVIEIKPLKFLAGWLAGWLVGWYCSHYIIIPRFHENKNTPC
jgi:hypothetical protein